MFKVFKLIAGRERTLLSGSVPSKAEAVAMAETEVAGFLHHGYNDEHGFFWGRNDSDERHIRIWVEG